jgi:hypothetical protein
VSDKGDEKAGTLRTICFKGIKGRFSTTVANQFDYIEQVHHIPLPPANLSTTPRAHI